MLQSLKKYQRFSKPFYGMNKGTFGFLMNKYDLKKLVKRVNRSKLIKVPCNSLSLNFI